MHNTLEYKLCCTHRGMPLVRLDSPLGSGREIEPGRLNAPAYALLDVAAQAEKQQELAANTTGHAKASFNFEAARRSAATDRRA